MQNNTQTSRERDSTGRHDAKAPDGPDKRAKAKAAGDQRGFSPKLDRNRPFVAEPTD